MTARDPVTAYVGLGANLGDPKHAVLSALQALPSLPRTQLVRSSSLYSTDPLGYVEQPRFVNAVAELRTTLAPRELLGALLSLEAQMGRTRSFTNAPRTLDLDLLMYGDEAIDEPGLQVPHPRMHERRFVLEPLLEIAPGAVIPGHGPASHFSAAVAPQGLRRLDE